jgi:hypothetical protein
MVLVCLVCSVEVEVRKANVHKGVMQELRAKLTSKDNDHMVTIAKLEQALKRYGHLR